MLKKLASPRRGTRREGLASLDVDDEQAEAGRTKSSSGKTKEDKAKEKEVAKLKAKEKEVAKAKEKEAAKVKKEEEAKAKKDKAREDKAKEKAKKKKHKSPDAEALAMGEAKAIGEGVRDEAKEAKTPSPRKSFARTFSRRGLFDDKTPEEMSPTKSSPTKKSPRKSLMKLPKPAKKSKSVIKKQETKLHDEDQQAEAAAPTETDPLTSTKADTESPTRKSRWKIDIKHHKSSKSSNNQKKHTHDEEDTPKANKDSPQSKRAHNARHESPRSPRDRAKRTKSKRELSNVESSTGDTSSEHDNQTNVLSPLRRHKPDPEDTLPIPEAPQSAYLLQKRMAQLDVPPAYQPEVHLVGEIVSGQGFGTGWGFCCKWRVEYGSRWSHIAGDQSGQTQVDYPPSPPWGASDVAVWSHPIDLHFATTAFQGWPKLQFQVYRVDSSMKHHAVGYGFVPVPFAAGQHELTVSLWRPLGTMKEELDALLFGRTPELTSDDVLFNAAWSDRCRLRTISTGNVVVNIGVLLRNFQPGVIAA